MSNDSVSKSWFCVLPNPEEHHFSGEPKEICDAILAKWVLDEPLNTGVVIYCISAEGLKHLHCVFESITAMRFSKIKKVFKECGLHIEATKGTREQVEQYITKQPPFDEKGEIIVCMSRKGSIKGSAKKERVLEQIESLLQQGMLPSQIMDLSIYFRQHEAIIRKTFFAQRLKEVAPIRNIDVYWHVGSSGTGKSYTFVKLCEKFGEDDIYMLSDVENGGLDFYQAEEIIFIDEFKGNMPYHKLLLLLDKYKIQFHARYSNIYSLWNTVHITSIYPPDDVYKFMVDETTRNIDSVQQLLRRITTIVYHYKENEEFKTYELPSNEYINYEDLKQRATGSKDKFLSITDDMQMEIPFN